MSDYHPMEEDFFPSSAAKVMSLSECARNDAKRNYGSDAKCIERQKERRRKAKPRYERNRSERIARDKSR